MKTLCVVLLATVMTSLGCVHQHGYKKASNYYRSMMTSVLSNPTWYSQYYNETDPQKKKELRD